eukprot:403335155
MSKRLEQRTQQVRKEIQGFKPQKQKSGSNSKRESRSPSNMQHLLKKSSNQKSKHSTKQSSKGDIVTRRNQNSHLLQQHIMPLASRMSGQHQVVEAELVALSQAVIYREENSNREAPNANMNLSQSRIPYPQLDMLGDSNEGDLIINNFDDNLKRNPASREQSRRYRDQSLTMQQSIHKKLIKNANTKCQEKYIFSKYCPNAPQLTNEMLIRDFDERTDRRQMRQITEAHFYEQENNSFNSEDEKINRSLDEQHWDRYALINQNCFYHGDNLNGNNGMSEQTKTERTESEERREQERMENFDALSCCNIQHNHQLLLGSSLSNAALSTCSGSYSMKSSCNLQNALEQIGATMSGLVSFDMFDDLSISDVDLRELTHISASQNHGNSLAERQEDLTYPINHQQVNNAQTNESDNLETEEFADELQLKMQLDSGRYMIEEFQRELQLKSLIAQQITENQIKMQTFQKADEEKNHKTM